MSFERLWEHVVELRPGASGTIRFRFPIDVRASVGLRLAAADQATGTVELIVDDPGHDYDMLQVIDGAQPRWKRVTRGPHGNIHFVLNLDAGERIHIEAEDKFAHSIRLTHAEWHGDMLRLAFEESC